MKTKVAIKSDNVTPLGGIFDVMDEFSRLLSSLFTLILVVAIILRTLVLAGLITVNKAIKRPICISPWMLLTKN